MRRGKKGKRDEAQSSLDAFAKVHSEPEQSPASEPIVPSMPDLDALARADEKIRAEEEKIEERVFSLLRIQTHDEVTKPKDEDGDESEDRKTVIKVNELTNQTNARSKSPVS